ncbi:MAG: hypothetical protein QOJ70_456 [Acidobacteriota bacterium]|jgi:hypothetical protein|nr:hypothetical protein [Acidobacteriota bacterium]
MLAEQQVLNEVMSQAVEAPANDAPCPTLGELQEGSNLEELAALRSNVAEAESRYAAASDSHTSALAYGIPALVVSFVALAAYQEKLFGLAPSLPTTGFYARIAILWIVVTLLASPIYYFVFRKSYITAKDDLWKEQQSYVAMRRSTEAGRRQYSREELFRLSSKAARVFFGDEQRFTVASKWAEKAGNILDGTDTTATLSAVQSYLNSLNELVTREEREQNEENRWQNWAIAVMFLYVSILVVSALFTNKSPKLLEAAVFGVPLSVILWGAAGSLAAILYRFYTEQGQIRFAAEFRWLIARPIIGIIMGAVVYLALISGMVLVSTNGAGAASGTPVSPDGIVPAPGIRMEAFWIIAFLAGFSDKFYLGVIDLLVARTVRSREIDSNTIITEKERIHDGSPVEQSDEKKTVTQAAAG